MPRTTVLSTPHGQVEVSWNNEPREDAANLSIEWREIGGPAVIASPQCKYGASIIRNLIPNELGGSVDLMFESGGVRCRIEIPFEAVRDENKARHRVASSKPPDVRLRSAVPR
jgi:two-component sensor histidine kinase